MSTGSLAYRRNAEDIWRGRVPTKYTRLLPYIPHSPQMLEIGAAEGVLSMIVANRDPSARVTALEMQPERHEKALELQDRWRFLGHSVDGCTMVCGDIRDRLSLLSGVDTFIAIRTIYHLGESITPVFQAVGQQVRNVVLCGNPNRARWHEQNAIPPTDSAGRFNYYAGVKGMTEVLEQAGFRIDQVVTEGDPIVTGSR